MDKVPDPHPREVEDGYELFKPTPQGIADWVRSTRPTPPAGDVAAHVRWLRDEGIITAADVRQVERLLPEVRPIG